MNEIKKIWEKRFSFKKSVIVINNRFNFPRKKLMKLFYLHCSFKKVVEKPNKENLIDQK